MAVSHFWQTIRKSAQALSTVINGPGKEATPRERATATGHTPGFNIANPWEELAHMTGWSFPAINAIASQAENASVCVVEKNKPKMVKKSASASDASDEQKTPIHDHPILDLLERPNPVFWREIFFYQIVCHYCLTGGFIIWEVRNEQGKPCELWALPRAWITFQTGDENFPLGLWRVNNPRGLSTYGALNRLSGGFYLDVRDTLILNRPHPLYPGEPLGTQTACGKIVDISEQTDSAVWSTLNNAPRPGMILSVKQQTPMTQPQKERMQAELQAQKGGVGPAGRILVLENVEMTHLGTPMGDLDAVNVRKQNQEFMQAIHSVPPIATGIRTETGSYAADAATINTWVELHMQPLLNRIAGCFNHRWHRYWPDVKVEISAKRADDPLLQMQRSDAIKDAVGKGGASWNEWRATMELEPMPGLDEIKEPAPPPMVGPDGQPMPQEGLPGDDDELPATGADAPPAMLGNRLPAFLLGNGAANGVAH